MTNLEITNAYVGSDQISKLYLGGEAIWPSTPPGPVYSAMPLTFEIISGGTIMWYSQQSNKVVEYQINDGNWTSITAGTGTSISVQEGDIVRFKGHNDAYGIPSNDPACTTFIGSGDTMATAVFNVYGNIMSLIDGDNYQGLQFTNANIGAFVGLFHHFKPNSTDLPFNYSLQSAANLILPDNVVDNCYRGMFMMCDGLVDASNLILPATTLAANCYNRMFSACLSLQAAPALPATNLVDSCYYYMFRFSTSLTTAPELPATALASRCYYSMFEGCTSLTTAPELPATALTSNCYRQMFSGCTNLNYIKCLATSGINNTNLSSWVRGVQSYIGTFVKDANAYWPSGDNGIPAGWHIIDAVIS